MSSVKLLSYAKINLALSVCGIYEDGFHELNMLNLSVDICDKIKITKRKDYNITCSMGSSVFPENNTAYKACEIFMQEFTVTGADIVIEKRIPFCAGLGGSSADAAAVLCGLKRLYHITDEKRFLKVAKQCGSDVSFMLKGGFALVFGKGEILDFFDCKKTFHLVLLKSGQVSTKAAYAEFDKSPKFSTLNTLDLKKAVQKGNIEEIKLLAKNTLTDYSLKLCPDIRKNIDLLKEQGAEVVAMSGSGSAVFGIFSFRKQAKQAEQNLQGKAEFCKYCKSMPYGMMFLDDSKEYNAD